MAKILVVESDENIRSHIISLLEQIGHSAFGSPNADHAWHSLSANADLSLLVVDAMLGGTEGDDLVCKVRDNQRFGHIPVIVISSGYVGPKMIASLLEHGAAWFMSKPINPKQLEAYVTKSLVARQENGGI